MNRNYVIKLCAVITSTVLCIFTVAINELLCLKNAGAQIAMDFSQNEGLAPMAIEKIKILGAILELPAKQQCQSTTDQMG